ncbi:hypothetical protein C7M84_014528 [Penaeus vannamei]|uniref:Uncharacterized protein n=1 Tax=Penaeus vannamei TaxID=6689 RepID=A0A423ST78_PENVA|nr:hypothetical protein C7M84_014528 [Penaeus vannamei]
MHFPGREESSSPSYLWQRPLANESYVISVLLRFSSSCLFSFLPFVFFVCLLSSVSSLLLPLLLCPPFALIIVSLALIHLLASSLRPLYPRFIPFFPAFVSSLLFLSLSDSLSLPFASFPTSSLLSYPRLPLPPTFVSFLPLPPLRFPLPLPLPPPLVAFSPFSYFVSSLPFLPLPFSLASHSPPLPCVSFCSPCVFPSPSPFLLLPPTFVSILPLRFPLAISLSSPSPPFVSILPFLPLRFLPFPLVLLPSSLSFPSSLTFSPRPSPFSYTLYTLPFSPRPLLSSPFPLPSSLSFLPPLRSPLPFSSSSPSSSLPLYPSLPPLTFSPRPSLFSYTLYTLPFSPRPLLSSPSPLPSSLSFPSSPCVLPCLSPRPPRPSPASSLLHDPLFSPYPLIPLSLSSSLPSLSMESPFLFCLYLHSPFSPCLSFSLSFFSLSLEFSTPSLSISFSASFSISLSLPSFVSGSLEFLSSGHLSPSPPISPEFFLSPLPSVSMESSPSFLPHPSPLSPLSLSLPFPSS